MNQEALASNVLNVENPQLLDARIAEKLFQNINVLNAGLWGLTNGKCCCYTKNNA